MSLLNDPCIKFKVDMIDNLQIDSAHFTWCLFHFQKLFSFFQNLHHTVFILQTSNVLITEKQNKNNDILTAFTLVIKNLIYNFPIWKCSTVSRSS